MKKLLILGLAFSMLLTACDKDRPRAQFSVNYSEIQPGEAIQFTNLSRNAVSFLWDFDDGSTATTEHPVHVFTAEGDYQVTLTVTSAEGDRDMISMWVYVYYTSLHITVAEWNPEHIIEYTVPNAHVILYNSLYEWDNDINRVAVGFTDYNGEVEFIGLYEQRYWVFVEATYYDNVNFYDYLPDEYLATPVLVPYAVNYWTAWCDYFGPAKKSASRVSKEEMDKIKNSDRPFIIYDVSE